MDKRCCRFLFEVLSVFPAGTQGGFGKLRDAGWCCGWLLVHGGSDTVLVGDGGRHEVVTVLAHGVRVA